MAMDTNTGESPGHQSQSQKLGNSPSEEEMGHWALTGVEPRDYDDDDPLAMEGKSNIFPNIPRLLLRWGGQSLYLSWMGAWMDLLPVDPPVTKSTCSCSVMVRAPVPVNIG